MLYIALEESRNELHRLIIENAPYDRILEQSQKLDRLVLLVQKKKNKGKLEGRAIE